MSVVFHGATVSLKVRRDKSKASVHARISSLACLDETSESSPGFQAWERVDMRTQVPKGRLKSFDRRPPYSPCARLGFADTCSGSEHHTSISPGGLDFIPHHCFTRPTHFPKRCATGPCGMRHTTP